MARHSRSLAHKDHITRSNASYLAKITSQPHPTGGMRHWPHQGSNHRRNRILRHPLVLAMPPHWLALRQPQQSALGRTVPAKTCADCGAPGIRRGFDERNCLAKSKHSCCGHQLTGHDHFKRSGTMQNDRLGAPDPPHPNRHMESYTQFSPASSNYDSHAQSQTRAHVHMNQLLETMSSRMKHHELILVLLLVHSKMSHVQQH